MSDSLNPYSPQPFGSEGGLPQLPGQRPATAMIFGILNIVFGILGLCGNLVTGGMLAAVSLGTLDDELAAPMEQFKDPVTFGFISTQLVVGTILAIVAIVSGIGLIKFRPWGRTWANFYAITSLLLIVAGLIFTIFYTIVPAVQAANDPAADPTQVGAAIGGIVGGIAGSCFGMIYPICVLVFLNRKIFVDAIESQRN
jgi:hypothetical protein